MAEETVEKRQKKLSKSIEGTVVTIVEGVTGEKLEYDFSTLPDSIQTLLGPFGLGHKLGDAAAGKEGQEAVDSINKVWEGLMRADWSVRAPAAEKITVKGLFAKVDSMVDGDEKEIAKALLEKLFSGKK